MFSSISLSHFPDFSGTNANVMTRLTPHRKKSVRNPRVKKKEKYKEKQKKLKSMKQVFDKGAAAKGSANYGGELTGIKSGLVRSRKL